MTRISVLICGWFLFFTLPPYAASQQRYQDIDDYVRLNDMSSSLKGLAQRVSPAIVQVSTKGFYTIQGERGALVSNNTGSGSGVILDPDGFIVTNAHVVEGAQKVEIILTIAVDGDKNGEGTLEAEAKAIEAEILGVDRETDIAVLKIDRKELPFLKLADSSRLEQGELVLACGSPFGLQNTLSMGIVSSAVRELHSEGRNKVYIQTDAPINPGNSGGALINMRGEVLGINTFILSQSGGSEGLGFAIPSNLVNNVYQQIKTLGYVRHSYLGIQARTVNSTLFSGLRLATRSGAIVEDVDPKGPAARSGLRPGDVIVGYGENSVTDTSRLAADIAQCPIGADITLEVLRGEERLLLPMTVGERPQEDTQLAEILADEASLIRPLGVLGVDVTEKVLNMLPPLRKPAGVLVVAGVAGAILLPEALIPGDLISMLNGAMISDVATLRTKLGELKPGDSVVLQIQRESRFAFIAFDLP
jgi:serine protease Do